MVLASYLGRDLEFRPLDICNRMAPNIDKKEKGRYPPIQGIRINTYIDSDMERTWLMFCEGIYHFNCCSTTTTVFPSLLV